jgi:Outer membrane protein beta-barrel domain
MTSRTIVGLAVAALLALPAAASAQSQSHNFWVGGAFGLETTDGFSGYQLRLDGEVPVARLSPKVLVSGVGTFAYSSLSHGTNVWKLLPAARFAVSATPVVDVYGDLGLGVYHAWNSAVGSTGAVMRIGAGVDYLLNPNLKLWGDAALNPHFGDFGPDTSKTTFTLVIGVKGGF